MANRKVTINIDTTANVTGAKQAAAAMDNLATSSNKATTAAAATGKGASRVGQLAGQAGFQIQDFAVQVGAGTSALTAFSQQAPQLLGAFGPAGAIAGAVVAIGAIAAKVFLQMADDAKAAGDAGKEAGEKMLEVFKKVGGEDADLVLRKIGEQIDLNKILREGADGLLAVQNNKVKSDHELAKSQAIATEEALKYLEATGQIKSAEEAIIALRKETAEMDKNAAVAQVEVGIQTQRNLYDQIQKQTEDIQSGYDKAVERLNKAREEEIKFNRAFFQSKEMDDASIKDGRNEKGFKSSRTNTAEQQLNRVEAEIEQLLSFIETAPDKIGSLTASAYEQGYKVEQALAEGKIAIDALEAQFNTAQQTEEIKQTVTDLTAGAKELSEEITKFEPINEMQRSAKESILAAAADGQLTAQELQSNASNLQILIGTLKTGQGGMVQSLQELITLNNELTSKVAAQNNAISNLRTRINSLTPPPTR